MIFLINYSIPRNDVYFEKAMSSLGCLLGIPLDANDAVDATEVVDSAGDRTESSSSTKSSSSLSENYYRNSE